MSVDTLDPSGGGEDAAAQPDRAFCPNCKASRSTFASSAHDELGKQIGELWFCHACSLFFARAVRLAPPPEPAEKTGAERRKHRRFNVNFVVEALLEDGSTAGPQLATTINASEGGVCFLSPRSLEVGKEGRFRVSLPSVAESFEARGRIVRCLKASDDFFGVGVSFTDVDERYRSALNRYVRHL